MSTPELLKDLLVTIQCLQKELAGSDAEKVKVAQEAYQELLEGFYEEYQNMLAPQQYRAAKDDPDYFLMLIKLALYHEQHEKVGKQEEQSISYLNWKLFTQIIGGHMKKNFRVRFNPVTKEIEIEGTELFVKTYFSKLQAVISGASEETAAIKRKPKAVKAAPKKKAEREPRLPKAPRVSKAKEVPKALKPTIAKRVKKTVKKAPAKKRVTNIDVVVGLIQGAPEGISTAELKTKTGLAESQIWNIVNRATKLGKVRKVKRGVYGGVVAASQE